MKVVILEKNELIRIVEIRVTVINWHVVIKRQRINRDFLESLN